MSKKTKKKIDLNQTETDAGGKHWLSKDGDDKQLTEHDIVVQVAEIAEKAGFTPLGLENYCRDVENNPDAYGPGYQSPFFVGYQVKLSDVTRHIASKASHFHREKLRESIRKWQLDADAANKDITYVLEGDIELGQEKVMERRRRRNAGPEILDIPAYRVVQWCGGEGWDYRQVKVMLAAYGLELDKDKVLVALSLGETEPLDGLMDDDDAEEIYEHFQK